MFEDTFQILFGQRTERNIIALEEGRAEVIILHIEAASAVRRHLVDKAENAVVAAAFDLEGWQFNAKIVVSRLFDPDGFYRTCLFFHRQGDTFVCDVEPVINHITDRFTVDRNDMVPHLKSETVCNTAGSDPHDFQQSGDRYAHRKFGALPDSAVRPLCHHFAIGRSVGRRRVA